VGLPVRLRLGDCRRLHLRHRGGHLLRRRGRPSGAQRFLKRSGPLPAALLAADQDLVPRLDPVAFGTVGWHALFAADQPIETWAKEIVWWIAPAVDGATLLLTVYCTRSRSATGAQRLGTADRDGLALFRLRTRPAMTILLLVLLTIGVTATIHYVEKPGKEPPVPASPRGWRSS